MQAFHARAVPIHWRALLLLLLPAACSHQPGNTPVDWWHGLEGGFIAETRPPPPNANAPYPLLTAIPPQPAPPDAQALSGVAQRLAGDRASAQLAEQSSPLTVAPASRAAARPAAPASPADGETPSASLPAASASQQVPAGPLVAAAAPNIPSAPAAAPSGAAAAQTAMPEVPEGPPPLPELAGAGLQAGPAGPPQVPPAPAPGPSAAGPADGRLTIAFAIGSASLPPNASSELARIARRRGTSGILVTGFGDAASRDPSVQAYSLALALKRARIVAASLSSQGVPASAIQVRAGASGNGAGVEIAN